MALFFPSKEMLLVLTLSISLIRFGSSLTLFDYDIEIGMQCTINGKTGGAVVIKPFTPLGFKVPLLVGERTLATCEMTLHTKCQRFVVFGSDRDLKRCNGRFCTWIVTDGALYLRINGLNVIQYRW